jgi:hypothetical protein
MDVIANARAVRGVVIIAEDRELWDPAGCCQERKRDKVRFRIVTLSNLPFGICASSVEIA